MTALQAQAYQLIDQLSEEKLAEAVRLLNNVRTEAMTTEERAQEEASERQERLAAFARLDALCRNTPKLKIGDEEWAEELQNARLGKHASLLDTK